MPDIQKRFADKLKDLPNSSELGFGKYFSDHWFHSRFTTDRGWYEAKLEPYGVLPLDPAASVLHYGQALFEGMKAFRQTDGSVKLFRPEFNYHRMCDGAERLCLEAPTEDLFMNGVRELVNADLRWVPKEEQCALYLRPTLIGTEGFLGVRPSREVIFFVLASPVGSYYGAKNDPVKIWVEEKALRAAPGGLGATKAGANYAASLQAGLEAKKNGYSQVLWLDVARSGIEEVGTMNVFFVFKDEIVTPALNGSILPGGVRDSALQLLRADGKNVNERHITIGEVVERIGKGELLEAFGTGTAAMISPIGELRYQNKSYVVNQNQWGTTSRQLFETITGIQRGRLPDRFEWMVKI